MKKILATTILISFISQPLIARDEYDRTFDSIYTTQKIYYSLDKRLNKIFAKLKGKLSTRGKKVLMKSENEWVYKRDHTCAFPRTNSVNVQCAVSETKIRLHFLEDRVRECEELQCRIDRL